MKNNFFSLKWGEDGCDFDEEITTWTCVKCGNINSNSDNICLKCKSFK